MSTPWIVATIVAAFVLGTFSGIVATLMVRRSSARGEVSGDVARWSHVAESSAEAALASDSVARMAPPRGSTSQVEPVTPSRAPEHRAEYVITSVGEPDDEVEGAARTEFTPRPQLEQLARTVMIEAASFAHGVRSALSEENRAKISYDIKRELIRARKGRKTEVIEALREYRATHRASVRPDSGSEL